MHVAHLNKLAYPVVGGIEHHVHTLARELAAMERVKRVSLLAFNTERSLVREGEGKLFITKLPPLVRKGSLVAGWGMGRELRRLRPDITHVHFPSGVPEIAYFTAGRPGRLVVTYHSDIVRQKALLALYRPVLRRLLDAAGRIIVTSPQMAQNSEYLQPYREKCEVVPLGIDVEAFAAPVDPARVERFRKELGEPLVLFVGRFVYYKGVEYLLRSVAQLPGVHLALVGTGPLEARLRALAKELTLERRVRFLGGVDREELIDLYHAADLFVLPSVEPSEAYGLVQVEAHASGLPVVSTNLPTGVPFVNVHGETGLVVPPRSVEELAAAIRRLLEREDERAAMGRRAQERARREFSKEVMAQRTLAVYERLLRARG